MRTPDKRRISHMEARNAGHGSAGDHDHAFGHQLADDARAAGAEREAHGNLFAASGRAGEHHVADVGAGDQHDEARHYGEEGSEERQVLLAQGQEFAAFHQEDAAAFLRAGGVAVLLFDLLRGGIQFGLHARGGDAGPQAADHVEDAAVAAFQRVAGEFGRDAFAHRERHPKVGGKEQGRGAEKFLRPHADDGDGLRIDAECAADGGRVGCQVLLPEAIADHHRGDGAGLRFGVEEAAQRGADAQRGEVRGRDELSPLALGLPAQGDAERHGRDVGQRGSEQVVVRAIALVVGIGGRQLQGDQFFGVRHCRKGAQGHPAHLAEGAGDDADAEGEREQRDGREAGRAGERA